MGNTQQEEPPKRVPVLPWMRSPVDVEQLEGCPLPLVSRLDPRLEKALEKMGIKSLFPVQVALWLETIGPGAFERDICVNAPTGSGKTLAYALPIVQKLSTRNVACLRALVMLPTRDLAMQVKEVFDAIAPAVGLRVGLAVGQSSISNEISTLITKPKFEMSAFDPEDLREELQSSVDILVATPGRLIDHINTTIGFSLKHLCYLVVDETDRLLREDFQSWLPTVIQFSCSNDEALISHSRSFPYTLGSLNTIRRFGAERGFKGKMYPRLVKMILSATLTQDPSKLSQLDLQHPLLLTSGNKRYKLPETLESYKLICGSKLKALYLVTILQDLRGQKCIVFTSSKESTQRLISLLNFFINLPFKYGEFSGLHKQAVRSKTLKAFRKGKIEVLVATDAMTRGMDVEGVTNVINYNMPRYAKTYIHRAGRTARAGLGGRCITLLSEDEDRKFKKVLQKAGDDSCTVYSLSTESIEHLRPIFLSAVEKRNQRQHGNQRLKFKSRKKEKEDNMKQLADRMKD